MILIYHLKVVKMYQLEINFINDSILSVEYIILTSIFKKIYFQLKNIDYFIHYLKSYSVPLFPQWPILSVLAFVNIDSSPWDWLFKKTFILETCIIACILMEESMPYNLFISYLYQLVLLVVHHLLHKSNL